MKIGQTVQKLLKFQKNSSLTRCSECIGSRNCPGKCKVQGTLVKKCPGNVPVFLSFSYPWLLCDIVFSKVSRNYPGFLDLFQVTKDPVLLTKGKTGVWHRYDNFLVTFWKKGIFWKNGTFYLKLQTTLIDLLKNLNINYCSMFHNIWQISIFPKV